MSSDTFNDPTQEVTSLAVHRKVDNKAAWGVCINPTVQLDWLINGTHQRTVRVMLKPRLKSLEFNSNSL